MNYKLLLSVIVLLAVPLFSQSAVEYYAESYKLLQSGDYKNALVNAEKAIEEFEYDDEEVPEYFYSLIIAGKSYEALANYAKSIELLEKAKEKYSEGEDEVYAIILGNLASSYNTLGNYEKAEPLLFEVQRIYKEIFGEEHPSYATSLNNLGNLYYSLGNYTKAEPYILESMQIRKKVLGEDHPVYASSLMNLAQLYKIMGNYAKAEPLLLEAIKIIKKALGKENPSYAQCLNNLAGLYNSTGQNDKIEVLLVEANQIYKKTLGEEHPLYASTINNLAWFYAKTANYLKAESLFIEATSLYKKILGPEHPDYVSVFNNFGVYYYLIDNYAKAEPILLEAIRLRKKVIGEEHPDYALSLMCLGGLYHFTGKYSDAYPLFDKALSVREKLVKISFATLSETEKAMFAKKDDNYYEFALNCVSSLPIIKSKSIYERILFRKGLILNSSVNTKNFISLSNDDELKQKYAELLANKKLISNLYSKTIEQRNSSGLNLDSLENYTNNLEKELGKISSSYKDFVMIPDYKWEEVKKNLKPNEAIVDMVKFPFFDKKWTETTKFNIMRYGVFVTKNDSTTEPIYFELKDGNRIDTLVIPELNAMNKNRFDDTSPDVDYDKVIDLSEKPVAKLDFYTELFEPIARHLKGIKKIYFSLDGEFYKVNFNTIKNPKTNKYLIEEYEIVYVSSAIEIAKGKTETTPTKTAVLVGYPNYDLSLDSLTALSQSTKNGDGNRDVYVNTTTIKRFNLDMLPGTKEEAETTTDLLKNNGWGVESWLYNQATESNVKSVKAPGILSISTHGYFSPSPKADYKESFLMGTETQKAVENPLLRSGLFLTGAETFLNSGERQKEAFEENGILTAFEASQLNLFGTDLVILSACETGLGEVNNGEGVFGLQRGFLGAGARSVLMSLWKVDDTATKDLMIEFIKNYSITLNKQKSLRDAQLIIMKKYPLPYFWGAFVMIGD